MAQLVLCIKTPEHDGRAIPIVVKGSTYTVGDVTNCLCGRWLYINEANPLEHPQYAQRGELLGRCGFCRRYISAGVGGDQLKWLRSHLFVPLNDPDLKEEPERYGETGGIDRRVREYLAGISEGSGVRLRASLSSRVRVAINPITEDQWKDMRALHEYWQKHLRGRKW